MLLFALKNLFLRRKRYMLMAIAIAVGFALITVITGLSYGALETMKTKAARYFSGHIIVQGFKGVTISVSDADAIVRKIKKMNLPVRTVSPRTIYYGKEVRLFFGGNYIRLLRIVGTELDSEKSELSRLPFTEGGISEMAGKKGENGIFISTEAAKLLGARLGDDLILYLMAGNQYNTANMVVRGIFNETNIFGYAAYMRREDLNRIMNRPDGWATEVAVYTKEGANIPKTAEKLRLKLGKSVPVFPPILSRYDFSHTRAQNKGNETETFGVMSVDAQLMQLKDLLNAFLLCTYFVLFIFLFIVMMGILNTYRVLIYERTREIGTMRAVGMQIGDVKKIFLYEAFALAVIASAAGFVLGLVTFFIAGLFDLTGITAAGMFTENGRLRFFLNSRMIFLNLFFMISAVLAAAWGPVRKASIMPPAVALRKD